MTQARLEKVTRATNDVPVQVQRVITLGKDHLEIRVLFLVEQVGDDPGQLGALFLDHFGLCAVE